MPNKSGTQQQNKDVRNIMYASVLLCARSLVHTFNVCAIIQPMSLSKYLNDFILHEFRIFHRICSRLFSVFFFYTIHWNSVWFFPFMTPMVLHTHRSMFHIMQGHTKIYIYDIHTLERVIARGCRKEKKSLRSNSF